MQPCTLQISNLDLLLDITLGCWLVVAAWKPSRQWLHKSFGLPEGMAPPQPGYLHVFTAELRGIWAAMISTQSLQYGLAESRRWLWQFWFA